MSIYINKGSLANNKSYLVVKGKRVYTGEEFKATEKDIKILEKTFNIEPKIKSKTAKSKQFDPKDSVSAKEVESPQNAKQTFSEINFKTTNSNEGVK